MKKSIIIAASVAGALAVAYSGTSWYVGRSIEQGNTAYLKEMEKQYGFFRVDEKKFKNKVFTSDETIVIALPVCPDASPGQAPSPLCNLADNPISLKVTTHYSHGPLPGFKQVGLFTYRLDFGLDPKTIQEMGGEGQELPKLFAEGLVKLDGATVAQIKIPAIQFNSENSAQFVSKEILGQVEASKDLATVTGNFSIPLLSFFDPELDNHVEVSGITIKDNWTRIGKHLFSGNNDLSVDKVVVDVKAPDKASSADQRFQLILDKLNSRYGINESGGLINFSHTLGGESLLVSGQQFGPFALNTYFRNVQTNAMDNYMETMQKISSPLKSAPETGLPPEQLDAIKTALVELSQSNPSFGFEKLEFKLPGGDAHLNLDLAVQALSPNALDNPNELLGKVELKSAASVTEKAVATVASGFVDDPAVAAQMLRNVNSTVEGLVAQGFLRREQDRLATEAAFANRTLTVNGKVVPLPNLPSMPAH